MPVLLEARMLRAGLYYSKVQTSTRKESKGSTAEAASAKETKWNTAKAAGFAAWKAKTADVNLHSYTKWFAADPESASRFRRFRADPAAGGSSVGSVAPPPPRQALSSHIRRRPCVCVSWLLVHKAGSCAAGQVEKKAVGEEFTYLPTLLPPSTR